VIHEKNLKQQSGEPKTLVNQYEGISPRIFLLRLLYSPTGMMSSGGRRNPYFPLSLNSMAAKDIYVPVVYMAQDVMIMMRE
jgi:hypothetical protein